MERRRFLQAAVAAPAIVGLGGCANTMNTVYPELLHGAAPSKDAAWNLLPAQVRKTITTHPAFKNTPPVGIQAMSVWTHPADAGDFDPTLVREILADRAFTQVGPVFYEISGHRRLNYTAELGHGGMLRHASGLRLANFDTVFNDQDRVIGFSAKYITTALEAEGVFRLKPGAQSNVTTTRTPLNRQGQLAGDSVRVNQVTRVEKCYGPVELWRELALGNVSFEAPAWLVFVPSFLMGNHYRLTESSNDGQMRSSLFSEIYSLIVAVALPAGTIFRDADVAHYGDIGEFGSRMDASHMRGSQLILSDEGEKRLRAARVDLEAEIYRQLAVASFIPLERKTSAAPMFKKGQQLWKEKKWAEAVQAFDDGLAIDPSHAPSRLLYADALRRAYPRPTARSLAADRLAWVSLRMAQALDPDGHAGQTARQMLATLKV